MILLCKFHWPKKQLTKFRMFFLSPRSLGASENMVLGHVTGIVKKLTWTENFICLSLQTTLLYNPPTSTKRIVKRNVGGWRGKENGKMKAQSKSRLAVVGQHVFDRLRKMSIHC